MEVKSVEMKAAETKQTNAHTVAAAIALNKKTKADKEAAEEQAHEYSRCQR